jgi:tetratricopeptide (TPR) repeat protein
MKRLFFLFFAAVICLGAVTIEAYAKDFIVVVIPFDKLNKIKDKDLETLKRGISETLSGALSSAEKMIIIDSSRVKRYLFDKIKFKQVIGADDSKDMEKLRKATQKKLNGDYLVYGNFMKIGNQIQITAKFMRVKSGKVEKAASVHGQYPKEIFALQEKLAKKLIESITGKKATSENRKKIKEYTNSTKNYNAYQYYIKGRMQQIKYDVNYYPAAVRNYKKALDIDPTYSLAWAGLSEVNALWGYRMKYAKQPWKQFINRAVKQGRKAVQYGNNLYQAHKALSVAYLNKRDFKASQRSIDRAYRLNRDDAEVLYMKAQLKNYGSKKVAVYGSVANRYITKALKNNPDLIIARWSYGLGFAKLKQYRRAIREYKKILPLNPNHAPVLNNISSSYYSLKDYDNAIRYGVRAINTGSKTAQHHYNLALAYYVKNRLSDAERTFKNAVKYNPRYEKAWLFLAHTYYKGKQWDKAIRGYNKVLRMFPNNYKARKWKRYAYQKKRGSNKTYYNTNRDKVDTYNDKRGGGGWD